MKNYLNFEANIKNLETEIDKLKDPYNSDGLSEVNTKKISETQKKNRQQIRRNLFQLKSLGNNLGCQTRR